MEAHGYPEARRRPMGPAVRVQELYGRFESTGVEVTLGDADATVLDCSGTPQRFQLTARTNGALFTLTRRFGGETDEIIVLPNQTREIRLPRERVVARNLVAGSNAAIFVEAFYAAEEEAAQGRREGTTAGADFDATYDPPETRGVGAIDPGATSGRAIDGNLPATPPTTQEAHYEYGVDPAAAYRDDSARPPSSPSSQGFRSKAAHRSGAGHRRGRK